jgi:hypothetical protein
VVGAEKPKQRESQSKSLNRENIIQHRNAHVKSRSHCSAHALSAKERRLAYLSTHRKPKKDDAFHHREWMGTQLIFKVRSVNEPMFNHGAADFSL